MESNRRLGKAGWVAGAIGVTLVLGPFARPADAYISSARGFVIPCGSLERPGEFFEGGVGYQFAAGNTGPQSVGDCEGEAEASAFASQAQGALRATSSAGGLYASASTAVLETTVTLFGPTSAATVTDTFELIITGTATSPYEGFVTSAWNACISVFVPSTGALFHVPTCLLPTFGNGGPIAQTVTLEFTTPVVGGQVQLIVNSHVGTNSYGTYDDLGDPVFGGVDLGNTAYIVHRLPPGWTAIADPEIFLSESPYPVPEPAQGAQLGSVFATLALLRRSRRERHVHRL